MTVQRVGGAEVVTVALTPMELLVLADAAARYERHTRRQRGVGSPMLAAVVERLRGEAARLADPDADIRTGRPGSRGGHADVGDAATRAGSSTLGTSPARTLSTAEVAEHLRVSARHVRRLLATRALDGAPVDGRGTWKVDPVSVTVLKAQRATQKGA